MKLLAALRCAWRGHHEPVRHPGGGFRCFDCHAVGEDLSEMGFESSAYVQLGPRHVFSRERYGSSIERTSEWGGAR